MRQLLLLVDWLIENRRPIKGEPHNLCVYIRINFIWFESLKLLKAKIFGKLNV